MWLFVVSSFLSSSSPHSSDGCHVDKTESMMTGLGFTAYSNHTLLCAVVTVLGYYSDLLSPLVVFWNDIMSELLLLHILPRVVDKYMLYTMNHANCFKKGTWFFSLSFGFFSGSTNSFFYLVSNIFVSFFSRNSSSTRLCSKVYLIVMVWQVVVWSHLWFPLSALCGAAVAILL